MIDTFKIVEDLKSRINPAYADWIGTESHELAQYVASLEQLQVELMAKQQHLASAFSQLQEAEEQLAQERKRLDWALKHGPQVAEEGMWWNDELASPNAEELPELHLEQPCENPRATIDELIAAEAAGGGE